MTHIYRKHFKSPYLGDYYSYSDVIVHCTVIQLGMVLQGRWICDRDLRKKVKTP